MQDPGCRTIFAVVTAWPFPTSCPARTVSKWQQALECLRPQNFEEVLSQHCTCSSYSHPFVQVPCSHLPINISLNAPQIPPPGSTWAAAAHRFPSYKATQEPGAHTSTARPGEQLNSSQSSYKQIKNDKQHDAGIKVTLNTVSVICHQKRANTMQNRHKSTAGMRQSAFYERLWPCNSIIFKEIQKNKSYTHKFIKVDWLVGDLFVCFVWRDFFVCLYHCSFLV